MQVRSQVQSMQTRQSVQTTNSLSEEEARASNLQQVKMLATLYDVRDFRGVDLWISATIKTFGRLNGAANLARVTNPSYGLRPITDTLEDEWDHIIQSI
jgi:hypothetical protein